MVGLEPELPGYKRGDDEHEPELDDSDLDSSDTWHLLIMFRL